MDTEQVFGDDGPWSVVLCYGCGRSALFDERVPVYNADGSVLFWLCRDCVVRFRVWLDTQAE